MVLFKNNIYLIIILRDRLKKKWMEFIKEDTRACGVDEDMIRVREKCRKKIRVADPHMREIKVKIRRRF